MNKFSYVVGATKEIQQGLIIWQRKIREYLALYYQGNQERLINAFFDPNHLYNHLEKIRANKQELLRKLVYLEEREQLLLAEIKRQEESSSNSHSSK